MTAEPGAAPDITSVTRWYRAVILTLCVSFIYALFGSFYYGDRPTWMPWTWLLGSHTVWVVLALVGMLALLRAWKVTLVAFFLAISGGLVIAVPFFWLMPRLYLPLQPTYYGVAIVYDDTYPASKVDQASDAVANLYTKDCLIRDRRKWATNPTKLSDMRLVPFLTWQAGVAYGFEPYKCDVGYNPPRTFAEKVTLGVTTGPLVVLELFIRALWGWFLPLLAGQVVFYKWKHEMIWEAHF